LRVVVPAPAAERLPQPYASEAPLACRPVTASSERETDRAEPLRRVVPGRFFRWVKLASWVELGLFAALLVFWLLPGFEHETFIFGLSHGLGFIALCLLIWIAVLRREAPYWLLAATLTPVGPVGSVIGIGYMERRSTPEA
jgi:hypothetical protein